MAKNKLKGAAAALLMMIMCIAAAFTGLPLSAFRALAEESAETELLYSDIPLSSFRVSGISPQVSTELDYVDIWYSEWDDCRYIFLPATADRSSLTITYSAGNDAVFLDGQLVYSGIKTSLLAEADEFDLTVGKEYCGKLRIMQSNLGCIYINTSHGGLDTLDNNRSIKETGTALMLDAQGNIQYSGELDKITAHGNSSWDYSKKKPYNIKLDEKADLYGMGKAKKWALLGNYLDHSMLRNVTAAEMSREAGMEYVMDSVFVDLFSDGSYRGTYQLIERVQVQKHRVGITDLEEATEDMNDDDLDEYPHRFVGASSLTEYRVNSYKYYDIPNDPDDITGGYLLQFQLSNRYGGKSNSGFVTSRGQAIQIDEPECASRAQVEYIRGFVQDLEDAVYSDSGYNGKGRHYSDYIDVDSLVIAYLVQEITMNPDATHTSFYLYKDSDKNGDGKLHFGPVWDFDLAYCNFITVRKNSEGDVGYSYDTTKLFAAYFDISGYDGESPTLGISWIGQLYKHQYSFRRRVAQVYFERFEPYLEKLTDTKREGGALITQWAEAIKPSAEMNNARWHMYGGRDYKPLGPLNGNNYTECADYIRDFVARRREGLNNIWESLLTPIPGDVNSDGSVNASDLVMMNRYILGNGGLTDWKAVDLNGNGAVESFDMALLRRLVLKQQE